VYNTDPYRFPAGRGAAESYVKYQMYTNQPGYNARMTHYSYDNGSSAMATRKNPRSLRLLEISWNFIDAAGKFNCRLKYDNMPFTEPNLVTSLKPRNCHVARLAVDFQTPSENHYFTTTYE